MVQERRQRLGMRGDELAFRIGRAPSWVSRIETGGQRNLPEPDIMHKLAAELGVSVADLLDAAGYEVYENQAVRADAASDDASDEPDAVRELVAMLRQIRLTADREAGLRAILSSMAEMDRRADDTMPHRRTGVA